ncbi:L protein [Ness Ziona virus]|uniref:RNA-directed RNA polymerase L n=1 Tax=Ness Ziona virus TaxID=2544873 RepID=A0A481U7T3_9VIRU|nr:L protein [Ness Ziona virus]QBH98892.1 L protein [Ness Ziona virus]
MDQNQIRQFRARIRAVTEPTLARDILSDMYVARHNQFAIEFCNANSIEYRNDVSATEIFLAVYPEKDPIIARHIKYTPDNFVFNNGRLYIIDFKVSTDNQTSNEAFQKYTNAFSELFTDIDMEVVIIRSNPIDMTLSINNCDFRNTYSAIPEGLNYNWFFDLRRFLLDKFRDNDEFQDMIDHGDFTLTAPWTDEDTPELYSHPIFVEFIDSLDKKYEDLFYRSLNFDAYSSRHDRWNSNLVYIKDKTQDEYQLYIKNQAKLIFEQSEYPKPSADEINNGWELMTERIKSERELINEPSKAKPSVHMIWSPPDNKPNTNIDKILFLSKELQSIKSTEQYSENFRALGILFDFSSNINRYIEFVEMLKFKARQEAKQVSNRKIEPLKIKECTVLWEQQFKYEILDNDKMSRSNFYKNFLGIGKHKNFKNRSEDDLELDKPKILDFNDSNIIFHAKLAYKKTKVLLYQDNNLKKIGAFLDEYMDKIIDSDQNMGNFITKLSKTNFWSAVNDFSVLMKNMLAVSQYNKFNSFRVVTCANNNLFGIVFPSSNIQTKKATIIFITICFHKDESNVFDYGAKYATFKTSNGYLTVSKGIRLDKERCQRIISSPGLFLLTSLLLYSGNDTLCDSDIMAFSFMTSLSITKSLLSLTEPSRFMIMNSLAISSNVKEYIQEKFSPYTKTLFSVYMCNLIKNGCIQANKQREKINMRNIFLTDNEITQKGVEENRDLESIWFPGRVNLKEYINQVYLPFYFNSKGLHEKHHVMIDLAKTVLEIEEDQRINIPKIWSESPEKQTVNLPVLLHSLAKNLINDTSRHKHLRHRVESRNNFKRSITTISTFTSSKSCIKIGDFSAEKEKQAKKRVKNYEKMKTKHRIANPILENDFLEECVNHADYTDLKRCIPEFIDCKSTKVFDELYIKIKNQEIKENTITEIMKVMKNHKQFYFAFFNKGQKTAKDREIFVGEYEAKMCLYCIERIAKERCKLNPEEMISEPGDSKLKKLEQKAEDELRFIIENSDTISDPIELEKALQSKRSITKLEINADMSKWSAQDVLYKYFWLFALDPILYPAEKKRIIFFLCNYMLKKLILPDELMLNILDQRRLRPDDIIYRMTNGFQTNAVSIKRNWLQGNLNYTSSYLHSCSMDVFRDINHKISELLEGKVLVNNFVHSDDNQTSITMIQDKVPKDNIIASEITIFQNVCLSFGNQPNMKKTYITNCIKEFVSLFSIQGEPFSIYGRFILTCVGDCAYIGPYEDLSSRISSTQSAIKHGCPPSIAWASIALNSWMTYNTYNMLNNQSNDPGQLGITRSNLPLELGGIYKGDLSTLCLVGMDCQNITFLTGLLQKYSSLNLKRSNVLAQIAEVESWETNNLEFYEIFYIKFLRYLYLESSITNDDTMGETSDMRSRSILTPRKFTTSNSLNRLESYKDYQCIAKDQEMTEELYLYLLQNPELLVTKGENLKDFIKTIQYRYSSKKFKESLSIQNPVQLLIEQILFSNKPTIDYKNISEKFYTNEDLEDDEDFLIHGKLTIIQALKQLQNDLEMMTMSKEDIKIVLNFCIANDPLMISISNGILLRVKTIAQKRLGLTTNYMPEFRNLKLIHNSPAVVLRAYLHGLEIIDRDQDELRRDVMHLQDFIDKSHIKNEMEERILAYYNTHDDESNAFRIRETTRFLQVCYDYIKSTEHKVKLFILPTRTYTANDFIAAIIGNLQSDKEWYIIQFLKPLTGANYKGQIAKNPDFMHLIADECFRLMAHFADSFVTEYSRVDFLKQLITDFTYKCIPIKELYELIKRNEQRHKFLPIMYHMGDLNQNDISRFDALKSNERITWNDWQLSQKMNIGKIDLTITGYNKKIALYGQDNKLLEVILFIKKDSYDQIPNLSRKLLNSRHNLCLEKMQSIKVTDIREWYLCYQKIRRNQFDYVVLRGKQIQLRNDQIEMSYHRSKNYLIPIAYVGIGRFEDQEILSLDSLIKINSDRTSLSRIKMNEVDNAIVKRANIQKMAYFDGPEIVGSGINLTNLMKSKRLLTLDKNTLESINMLDLIEIFKCDEVNENITFNILSEEELIETETREIDAFPAFSVSFNVKSKGKLTYKSIIMKKIDQACNDFESAFDFFNEGFCSKKTLGIIKTIIGIINILETNEWSTKLSSAIHISLFRRGFDSKYHTARIPNQFYDKIIKNTTHSIVWGEIVEESLGLDANLDWLKLLKFVNALPKIVNPLWSDIFEHFKTKTKSLIMEKIKQSQVSELETFGEELADDDGLSINQL